MTVAKKCYEATLNSTAAARLDEGAKRGGVTKLQALNAIRSKPIPASSWGSMSPVALAREPFGRFA
jgi:hypothetical protein